MSLEAPTTKKPFWITLSALLGALAALIYIAFGIHGWRTYLICVLYLVLAGVAILEWSRYLKMYIAYEVERRLDARGNQD